MQLMSLLPKGCLCIPNPDASNVDEFEPIVDSQILGVVRLVVQSGSFKAKSSLASAPTPFVKITTDVGETKFYTTPRRHTWDPNWLQETFYIPISSNDSGLKFSVKTRSLVTRHIGASFIPLDDILDAPEQDSMSLPLLSSRGEIRGHLLVSLSFSPVQTVEHPSEVGIVRLLVYEASGLARRTLYKPPSPRVLVEWFTNEEETPISLFSTPSCRGTTEPVWNSCYDFICGRKQETTLTVHVSDAAFKNSELGYMTIPLRDLLDATELDTVWWPLSGSQGKLKLRAEWRAVAIPRL